MSETLGFNAGTEAGANWTNDSNAWDGNDGTYAYRSNPSSSKSTEDDKWIKATVQDSTSTIGDIGKVEIGIRAEYNIFPITLYTIPIFNGTTDGSEHSQSLTTTPTTYWYDITNDAQAPESWTLDDIEDLDIKAYVVSGLGFGEGRIYEFYVRVTEVSPSIGYTPTTLTYTIYSPISGKNVDPQTVTISNDGNSGTTLTYDTTASQSWITIDTTSDGSILQGDTEDLIIDIDVSQLSDYQEYNETITINSDNADDSPKIITINVNTPSLWTEQLHVKYNVDSTANDYIYSDNFDSTSNEVWTETDYSSSGGSYVDTRQNNRLEIVTTVPSTAPDDADAYFSQATNNEDFDVLIKITYVNSSNPSVSNIGGWLIAETGIGNFTNSVGYYKFAGTAYINYDIGTSNGYFAYPTALPVWLRLTYINGTLTAYRSSNGTSWTEITSDTVSNMNYVSFDAYHYIVSGSNITGYVYFDDFENNDFQYIDQYDINSYTTDQVNSGEYMNSYVLVKKSDGTDYYIQTTSNLNHSNSSRLHTYDGTTEVVIITEFDENAS